MARSRSPNRDKAFEIYKENKGNITLREISNILDTPEKTISGWKSKDKWEEKLNGVLQKKKRSTPKKEDSKNNVKASKKEVVIDEVKEVLSNTELTDKQRFFCIYYIKCFNATKAYQKAYKCDYMTANVNGYRLLVKASVKNEIDKLKRDKLNRAMLSEDDIFQRYMDIAFADITDFLEFGNEEVQGEHGPYIRSYVNIKDSFGVDGTLISEVSQGKDGIKVKLQDKMKALQWLSDRMDLLPTNTKARLENEKAKLELDILKLELEVIKKDNPEEKTEDDGFIDALRAEVGDTWDDD